MRVVLSNGVEIPLVRIPEGAFRDCDIRPILHFGPCEEPYTVPQAIEIPPEHIWRRERARFFGPTPPPIPEDVLKRYEAETRAQELLCQHLTPQQCRDRGDFGYFWVETVGRKFCIGCSQGFIEEHDRMGKLASYCLQAAEWGLPSEDKVLAVLLMLRHTPDEFYSKANILWHRESRLDPPGERREVQREERWENLLDSHWGTPLEIWRPQSTYREWYDKHYHQKG